MELKELRRLKGLSQEQAAKIVGVSRRTYIEYEKRESEIPGTKLKYLRQLLEDVDFTDENHGILTTDKIKKICSSIFKEYDVEYCYLFGSYAKGKATETSDVDLFISTRVTGLKFFELAERLREGLNKKVDLLESAQIDGNAALAKEILKDGIKIYG